MVSMHSERLSLLFLLVWSFLHPRRIPVAGAQGKEAGCNVIDLGGRSNPRDAAILIVHVEDPVGHPVPGELVELDYPSSAYGETSADGCLVIYTVAGAETVEDRVCDGYRLLLPDRQDVYAPPAKPYVCAGERYEHTFTIEGLHTGAEGAEGRVCTIVDNSGPDGNNGTTNGTGIVEITVAVLGRNAPSTQRGIPQVIVKLEDQGEGTRDQRTSYTSVTGDGCVHFVEPTGPECTKQIITLPQKGKKRDLGCNHEGTFYEEFVVSKGTPSWGCAMKAAIAVPVAVALMLIWI